MSSMSFTIKMERKFCSTYVPLGAEGGIFCASLESVVGGKPHGRDGLPPFRLLARTRGDLALPSGPPLHHVKRRPFGRLSVAQKAGFEPALPFSDTTPLAGEPLEPLGYFCIMFTKNLLLRKIFFREEIYLFDLTLSSSYSPCLTKIEIPRLRSK